MKLVVNYWDIGVKPDKDLLGGKGAGLVHMTQLQMPVPHGFVLTTEAWREYDNNGKLSDTLVSEIKNHLLELEKVTSKKFGATDKPLLVSVRSGSRYSMPGMMDTIPNVGVNKNNLAALSQYLGGGVYATDTYKRFLRAFGNSVYGIHVGEFDILPEDVNFDSFEKLIFVRTGKKVPEDPFDQLTQSIEAIFRSWYNPGAVAYRQINGIPDQLGTAANVQMMVYGNRPNSGTGVLFTRNTTTGENEIIGDYLDNAQGDDIVRGGVVRTTKSIDDFAKEKQELANKLFAYAKELEKVQKDVQDIEFTIEDGNLWLLQTRSAKRTPIANIRIAKQLLEENIITEAQALKRIKPSDIEHVQLPTFARDEEEIAQEKSLFSTGVTASPGVATGYLAINPTDVVKLREDGKQPILICDHIDPNDVATLLKVVGVVTTKGSASSHMALIMRSAGIPGIVGASAVGVDNDKLQVASGDKNISVGGSVSINATLGKIYNEEIDIVPNSTIPTDLANLINKRTALYTRSAWSAGIYDETGSPIIPELVKRVEELRANASRNWQSEKARVIEVFDHFFDGQTMIKNRLVKPNDKESLKNALLEVINSGDFNAPRTCHSPVKLAGAPWADGPNSPELVEQFLTDPNYPGKYGGYPRWIEDSTLDAIIVGHEPKDKLNVEFANKHFVCTLSCVNGMTSQLVINVHFGTAQLRSLERVENTELATIKINLNPVERFSVGDKTYHLGRSFLDDNQIDILAKTLNENRPYEGDEVLHRTKRHLLKQLVNGYSGIVAEKIGTEELKDVVFDLMSKNMLPADVFHWVVNKQYYSLLEQISKIVMEKWWKFPIYLPHTMSALDEVSGLSVLEAQGRFDEDKILWFKIYGAKGSEERDKIKNWKG